jgi:hypothetical protein
MQLAKSCLAATILVLRSSTACNRKPAYEWHMVDAPDGTFSVSLPGDAAKVDTPTKSVTGGSFIAHGLNVRASKDAVYGGSWWEDPSRPIDASGRHGLRALKSSSIPYDFTRATPDSKACS